ncbi:MAG TPA: MaoC family dehydratase N-terminal domain-containing protein [Actinomycetota bacterium]
MDQSLKGKRYREVSFTLQRDRVTQFALATGQDDPIFLDADAARAAGYADQVAPPTFATVLQIMTSGQAVVDPELGLDYSRVVHGEQAYEFARPLVVGDVLSAVPRIADVYAKGPNEFLILEAEIHDAAGELVCVSRSTLLSRGTARG